MYVCIYYWMVSDKCIHENVTSSKALTSQWLNILCLFTWILCESCNLLNICPPWGRLSSPQCFNLMVPLSQHKALGSLWKIESMQVHWLSSALGLEVTLHHPIDTALLQTNHPALCTAERTGKEGGLETLMRICKTWHCLQIFSSSSLRTHITVKSTS